MFSAGIARTYFIVVLLIKKKNIESRVLIGSQTFFLVECFFFFVVFSPFTSMLYPSQQWSSTYMRLSASRVWTTSAEMQARFLFYPFLISNASLRVIITIATLIDTIRLDQTMKPMAYENKATYIKTDWCSLNVILELLILV